MSVAQLGNEEAAEAVIISGPRKGEIVTLAGGEAQLSLEEEATLEAAVEAAKRAAASAQRVSEEMRGLMKDLRRI